MDDYEPRVIISPEWYESYLIDLHRTLSYTAECKDSPNPFRSLLQEGDNLKVVINDTNDLRYCIKHFEQKILNEELEHVIIGDPHTYGYGFQLLDKMIEDITVPASYTKDKSWILVMLNTDNKKLVIEDGKIRVEEN